MAKVKQLDAYQEYKREMVLKNIWSTIKKTFIVGLVIVGLIYVFMFYFFSACLKAK